MRGDVDPASVNDVTGNFESPAVVNSRVGSVLSALKAATEKAPVTVAPSTSHPTVPVSAAEKPVKSGWAPIVNPTPAQDNAAEVYKRTHPDWMEQYREGKQPDAVGPSSWLGPNAAKNALAMANLESPLHHHYDYSDHSVTNSHVTNVTNHITGISDPQEAANAIGSTLAQVFPPSKSATRHLASALT